MTISTFPYLVSGSLAYDHILIHHGLFQQQILPEHISRLNLSFEINKHTSQFGGTAGNIAYNASLLNDFPMLVSSLGSIDSNTYISHLKAINIDTSYITTHDKDYSPNCWIFTDHSNNQIAGFSMGSLRHLPRVPDETPNIWLLSPETTDNTLFLTQLAQTQNKQYLLDPGQELSKFLTYSTKNFKDKDIYDFSSALKKATGLFVNEYEGALLKNHYGLNSLSELLSFTSLQFIIQTKGAKGVTLFTHAEKTKFSAANPNSIVDPTGCGDSFRAGFMNLYCKKQKLSLCIIQGIVLSSFAIEHLGGQTHKPSLSQIEDRKFTYSK